MSLQSVIRWLVPREDHFYGFLERQASTAHEAALALRGFKEGTAVADVRNAVQELEHEGDKISHEMEDALAKTFVTPIDREDLQKLSKELDDILDRANGAIRAAALYGVDAPTEPMGKLMDVLVACTEVLKTTMPNLRKNAYPAILESNRALRKLEKDGDTIFRQAVSELFRDAATDAKKLLREKQVLEDLENAVDHCERVGDTLAHLAVKHG
jgi:predicted phosphate transport protein (TIGR00153 family)